MPTPDPRRERPATGREEKAVRLADGSAGFRVPPGKESAWHEAVTGRLCLHCGLELGPTWRETDGPFCCRGCRSVFFLIHRAGLERFYELAGKTQAPASQLRAGSFAWLDRIISEQVPDPTTGPLHLSLDIQGVHCTACVWLLEELFGRQRGGLQLRINPTLGRVDLAWNRAEGDLRDFLAEVEQFGYRLGPPRKSSPRHSRRLLLRLAVCVAVALNVMMFSLCFYFGLAPRDGALYSFFGHLSLALATISISVGGPVFWRGAAAGLKRRVVHLDLPISLGMILAFAGSVYAFFTAGPERAYFDTLTVFVALMLVGRWAREHILERNRHSLLESAGVEGLTARRQTAGRIEAVAAAEIRCGDELWIAPGDLVPCSGILLRKHAAIATDWITGESEVLSVQPGQEIQAGAFNHGDEGFPLTATEDFQDSRLQELLRTGGSGAADDPADGPAPRAGWWSRVATVYVAAVLVLALGGFLLWYGQDPRRALEVTVAILVVTCPCALGLASPLAEELIHAALRRRGIFLRRSRFLEKALAVRKILWDKTGTLTLGQLVLTGEGRKQLWALSPLDKDRLWHMTARSNHPVSRCLAEAVGQPQQPAADAEGVKEFPGRGLECRFADRNYRLGNPGSAAEATGDENYTVFSVDDRLLARFGFAEQFRPDAAVELSRLRRRGFELHLLSGDAPAKVDAAARTLGIDPANAIGHLTPEEKAARVADLDRHDTLMVGDGLNDGPGFEAAHCAATGAIDRPVLPGKADFFFLGDGIAAVGRALRAAHRLHRVFRLNLAVAAVYNLAAVSLCLAGLVGPVVAAILMPLSSIAVVTLTAWQLSGRRLAWMS